MVEEGAFYRVAQVQAQVYRLSCLVRGVKHASVLPPQSHPYSLCGGYAGESIANVVRKQPLQARAEIVRQFR